MSQTREEPLLSMCAWCRRIKDATGEWRSGRAGEASQPITHGICPQCERQTLEAAERSRTRSTPDHSAEHCGSECRPKPAIEA